MKRKNIISLLAIVSFGLTLTGCRAKIEDFDKQIEKLDTLIKDEDIYNKDYKIEYSQTFKVEDDLDSINYTYIKDGDKIHANEYIGDNMNINIWYTPDQENNYIKASKIESTNINKKTYSAYQKETALTEMKEMKKSILQKAYNELNEAINECKLDDDDCSVDKKMFSKKYNFEAEIEINEDEKKIVKATIENGTLLYFELVEKVMNINLNKLETNTIKLNITYDNQTINFERTSDFTLSE